MEETLTTEELFGSSDKSIVTTDELFAEPLIAGRYKKKDLARKMIPQFTKGLYESDIVGDFGRPIIDKLP